MRRPAAPPARPFLGDADYDPMTGRNRLVGPPIPGKPRQTSRFGFAMDNQYGDSFGSDSYSTPQAMQDGFRALFPNVNVSFGDPNASLSAQQQQQLQQQQLQQQQQYATSPLFQRQEVPSSAGWDSGDKQDLSLLQRAMGQSNMDPMLTTPSSRMAEYHQQLQMQQHAQRSGPPGITRSTLTPSMVKSPPPGLETASRSDLGSWAGTSQQQQQHRQQHLQQSSRMNSWSSESNIGYSNNTGSGVNQDNTQDILGAFLKVAAVPPQPQSSNQTIHNHMAFQDPAIMSARISSANATKAMLVEALQSPSPANIHRMTASQDGLRLSSHDSMQSRNGEFERSNESLQQLQHQHMLLQQRQQPQRQSTPDSPSSLQNIPLGSKRKEIKSVKGVLNSGMNAPLNGSSRSRPSSTPGSPLVEPRVQILGQQQQQQPTSFGAGEPSIMNGLTSATARSAKVKSDLLMGLNSPSNRSDRIATTTRDSSEAIHQQQANSMKMNGLYGSTGQYDMNHLGMSGYGQFNLPGGSGAISGPPPGLGMPTGSPVSGSNNNSNGGSPYLMSGLLGRSQENNVPNGMPSYLLNNDNGNKPLDVASMMSALDFFGPNQASSLTMSPNWPMSNGNTGNNNSQSMVMNGGNQGMSRPGNFPDQNDQSNGSHSSPNNNTNRDVNSASASARSVEDLELQVINAKMETQMLENQLNAVIKRNRRKLYA
ncbi:hypothetical protein EDD21DRAFT_384162 [Dissophora ornata]|nr:hypothetical protein EDD21DRAFT_384162 [Dissophora ornata]